MRLCTLGKWPWAAAAAAVGLGTSLCRRPAVLRPPPAPPLSPWSARAAQWQHPGLSEGSTPPGRPTDCELMIVSARYLGAGGGRPTVVTLQSHPGGGGSWRRLCPAATRCDPCRLRHGHHSPMRVRVRLLQQSARRMIVGGQRIDRCVCVRVSGERKQGGSERTKRERRAGSRERNSGAGRQAQQQAPLHRPAAQAVSYRGSHSEGRGARWVQGRAGALPLTHPPSSSSAGQESVGRALYGGAGEAHAGVQDGCGITQRCVVGSAHPCPLPCCPVSLPPRTRTHLLLLLLVAVCRWRLCRRRLAALRLALLVLLLLLARRVGGWAALQLGQHGDGSKGCSCAHARPRVGRAAERLPTALPQHSAPSPHQPPPSSPSSSCRPPAARPHPPRRPEC